MTIETQARPITTAQLIEKLSRFDGPPEQFLRQLLIMQCRLVAAAGAAVITVAEDRQQRLAALWPEETPAAPPEWMAPMGPAISAVLEDAQTRIVPARRQDELYGTSPSRHAIVLPLRGQGHPQGAALFLIDSRDRQVLETCRERLDLTVPLLALYEMQMTLQQRQLQMQQLAAGMETTAAVNDQDRFTGAAMALCNDLAARWHCQRAGLGLLQGRYVRLKALSHTEKFSRKMAMVAQIESAMEECLDQDIEVQAPAAPEARYVYRAADELARRHGPSHVLALPLRHLGQCEGVLLLQRDADKPFQPAEIQALRLTADLAWPHVYQLSRHDRWIGAKAATGTRKALAAAVGPKHTWAKIIALGVLGFLLFALLGKTTYKVDAPFIITPATKHHVSAPFHGQLKSSDVRLGEEVVGDTTVLAQFDVHNELIEAARAKAQIAVYQTEATKAQGENKQADYQLAMARAEQARTQYELLQSRIDRATVKAPIDGIIVAGDWRQSLRRQLQEGEELFQIAPRNALEAELLVDERDVHEVASGHAGQLATLARPNARISFRVLHVEPVATTEGGKHGFKVRVALEDPPPGLLFGQTGVAKVELDRRSYAWVWTHRAIDWLRLKLWM